MYNAIALTPFGPGVGIYGDSYTWGEWWYTPKNHLEALRESEPMRPLGDALSRRRSTCADVESPPPLIRSGTTPIGQSSTLGGAPKRTPNKYG